MHEYDGVGLAAPQVHVGLRLAVIEVPASDERVEGGVPLTVLVNPRVTPLGEATVDGWEGCLSIPDLRGRRPALRRACGSRRSTARAGPTTLEAEGFLARVIQHECDHLDGGVYLDRMRGLRTLSFLKEFEDHVAPARETTNDRAPAPRSSRCADAPPGPTTGPSPPPAPATRPGSSTPTR